jgi:hypothetical protein
LTGEAPLPTFTSVYFNPEAVVTVLADAVFTLAAACSCPAIAVTLHIAVNTVTTTKLLPIPILRPPCFG